ncbi:MAG: N-acyl homoserine lactonase family protein [Nitrososphaerota archaeon]|nr:N-acyl homoserine lactonase family protein [Nitrososphaerota archaeon]MDG6922907.1 N-acyl homoserine lactonase family protein [Nitrososphaerota archaeon]
MVYSIYGVKVGQSPNWFFSGIQPVYRSDVGRDQPVPYPIWVIKGENRVVLVDTAFDTEVTAPWPKTATTFGTEQSLAEAGVDTSKVTDVIITHMHVDHFTGYTKFPQAKFYIQKKELDHCLGSVNTFPKVFGFPLRAAQDTIALMRHGRLRVVDGDEELFPGLKVVLAGGHTPGLQMLAVETEKGTAFLASDNAYLYHNLKEDLPVGYYCNLVEAARAIRIAKKIASSEDMIIPGHDYTLWGEKKVVKVF